MQFRFPQKSRSSTLLFAASSLIAVLSPEFASARTTASDLRSSRTPSASNSAQEIRLIVSYKQNLSTQARLKTHQLIGGKFKKHFSSINADLVTFELPNKESAKKFAGRLCEAYQQQGGIKSCEPDSKVEFPFQQECSSKPSANSNAIAAIPEMIQRSKDQRCEVVPTEGMISAQDPERAGTDGTWGVSPLWGQQAVGADLAAEFVSQRLQSGRASRVPTGNMDMISDIALAAPVQQDALKMNLNPSDGRPYHGDKAANLVSNPPFGASPAVSWSAIVNLTGRNQGGDPKDAWNSNVIDGLEAIRRSQTRIVTASIGFHGTSPRAAIDSFVDQGRVLVQSSGNDYPESRSHGDGPLRMGHIIVGSVGPNGIQSPFSQEPAKIYAPANSSQLSGPNDRFGGTSGATPLVTGSIVNALAILPQLSNAEVEELLARTSTPSFSKQAAGYGPGLLNSYRMAVVSACMADKSKDHKQTTASFSKSSCFDQSARARELRNEADQLLKNTSCVGQRDGFKALRASFLLDPSRDAALRIAEMYEKLGFSGDARWYRTAAAALGTPEQQRRHFDELLSEPSLSDHRYFAGSTLGATSKGFYALSLASRIPSDSPYARATIDRITALAKSNKPENQEQAIEQALIVGPRALPAINHLLLEGDDEENPRSAKRIIWKLAGYDSSPHPWTKETAAYFRGTRFEKYLPKDD